jgi:hypothetical protein
MLKKSENKVVLIVFLFLFYSCSAANLSAGGKKKPGWVKERPVSNAYYIGIGMASKELDNYIRVAKNNALSDLISEISVNISSNSVLRQFEDESEFKTEFESLTRVSIKDELEAYELVDSYDGKENYWVYYHLSIDTYKKIKRAKLEKAKDLAGDFYEKAQKALDHLELHQAINFYVKAFEAVKAYLEEDLSVFVLEKGRINLGNAIYEDLQDIFSKIKVIPVEAEYQIKALSGGNPKVKATVYYTGNDKKTRISGLPFTFSFPGQEINKTENVQSNASGEIICSIADMAPKGKQQRILAVLNTDVYFGEASASPLLKQMFHRKGSVPYGYLTVNVADLKAYFESEETAFGKPAPGQPVTQVFKKELLENFFSFTPNKKQADVIVKVTANTVEGKKMEQYNLHTAYLNCHISIMKAQTDEEVYSTGLQNIKGMKTGSYNMAAQNAREKAEEKIQQHIIPALRQMTF